MISRLRAEPGNDHAVFRQRPGDLDTQIAQRQAQLIAAASPYLPLVDDPIATTRSPGGPATIEQGLTRSHRKSPAVASDPGSSAPGLVANRPPVWFGQPPALAGLHGGHRRPALVLPA